MPASLASLVADLIIQADGPATRLASAWLARQASEFEVPASEVDRLELCLNEALVNIISHSAPVTLKAPVHLVLQVECHAGTGTATVTVSDAGPRFDSTLASPPNRPASLAEAKPGGLGLLLIRSFSDHLGYRYSNGHNHLKFGVRWASADE
ncbi:MAG: ATP-binding protein [Rhodoferax sp.]